MKSQIRAIAALCGVSDKEAVLYLLLSASGWLYFAYQYIYESGLGVAVPRYAGYWNVLRGSGIIEIAGKFVDVSEGDSVYIPSQVPHSYKAGKDGFEFICVVPNKDDKIEIVE